MLRTWGPPAIGGAAFLLLYILGNLDVIQTQPALAADALLLAAIVLYFPMRYAHRLRPRGRLLAAVLAVGWMAAVCVPLYKRIYPGARLATIEVTPERLPLTLAAAGRGDPLSLVIEGHLHPGAPQDARFADYRLTVVADGASPETISGRFEQSWHRQAQGRREGLDVMQLRTATTATVANPYNGDLKVTALEVRGQAEERLTLSLQPRHRPPWWLVLPAAIALLLGAVAFDRATGAGGTAASMTIATGAALAATYSFLSLASPHPTFRELFGAAIVGALLGGPLGGLVSWLFHARRRSGPRRTGARAS